MLAKLPSAYDPYEVKNRFVNEFEFKLKILLVRKTGRFEDVPEILVFYCF